MNIDSRFCPRLAFNWVTLPEPKTREGPGKVEANSFVAKRVGNDLYPLSRQEVAGLLLAGEPVVGEKERLAYVKTSGSTFFTAEFKKLWLLQAARDKRKERRDARQQARDERKRARDERRQLACEMEKKGDLEQSIAILKGVLVGEKKDQKKAVKDLRDALDDEEETQKDKEVAALLS